MDDAFRLGRYRHGPWMRLTPRMNVVAIPPGSRELVGAPCTGPERVRRDLLLCSFVGHRPSPHPSTGSDNGRTSVPLLPASLSSCTDAVEQPLSLNGAAPLILWCYRVRRYAAWLATCVSRLRDRYLQDRYLRDRWFQDRERTHLPCNVRCYCSRFLEIPCPRSLLGPLQGTDCSG